MNADATSRRGLALLPHPVLSGVLLVVWLLLNDSVHPRMLLLGSVFALAIPFLTQSFWPERPRIRRPGKLLAFLPVFLWDVLVANIQVAWMIVNVRRRLRPGWIVIPLDIRDQHAITMLANVISLTPGTVSSEIGVDPPTLLVHSLDVHDEAAMVETIKTRYEKPIGEIFE